MSELTMGVLAFVAMFALIALRVPIAIAMAIVGACGGLLLNGSDSVGFIMGSLPFETVFPYSLSVIPLFVLMGAFASRAGLSKSLYSAVNAFIGHYRGGLGMATVGACAGFGAICGSSLATAATMSKVAMPEMRQRNYDDGLAAASIAAGGTLGVLIPPSVIIVIYSLLVEQSIGKMFAAAIIPGIVATLLYMAVVWLQTIYCPELGPAGEKTNWAERFRVLLNVWQVLLLFSVVIGGIYLGWFSPTEAAAVGAMGALLLALAKRRLNKEVFFQCLNETATTSGMIFLIVIGTSVFNYFIETTGLPHLLVEEVTKLGWNPYAILVVLLIFYVVLGCVMDALSMILLTLPVVFPLVQSLGFDPIWFGIIIVSVVEVGLITPPVGMNLFMITATTPDLGIATISRGVVPFLLADIIRITLLILFPSLALWLPSLMT